MQRRWSVLLLLLVAALFAQNSDAAFGIDYGSQWFKIAVVRAGSIETLLNDVSKRKTPTVFAFDNLDRIFGEPAINLATKAPQRVVIYPKELLGRYYQQSKEEFSDRLLFPAQLQSGDRGEFLFALDEHHAGITNISAEEAVAMLFSKAKSIANAAGVLGKDVVITVPPFLTQQERQALIDSATIAGLNVVSLINDGAAVAYNYAMVREKPSDPEQAQNVLVVDIGAATMKVIAFNIKEVPDTNSKKNKTTPHVTVLGTAWDRKLGGREFDAVLARHFAKLANEQLRTRGGGDVTATPRAMQKLLREAKRIKEILSANTEIPVSVEGLLPDFDFRAHVTRKDFEAACEAAGLFARLIPPLQRALSLANLTSAQLSAVEIVGGGVRVPRVLEELKQFFGRELDKHISGDEGAVQGAALFAASHSASVRVREVKLKDTLSFNTSMRLHSDDEALLQQHQVQGEDLPTANGLYALFRRGSRLGSKKVVSLHTAMPFEVELRYDTVSSAADAPTPGAPVNFVNFSVSGFEKLRDYNHTGNPKVILSMRVSSSSLVEVEKAELEITVVSVRPPPPPPVAANASSETNNTAEGAEGAEKAEKEAEAAEEDEKAKEDTAAKDEGDKEKEKPKETEGELIKRTHRIPLTVTRRSPPLALTAGGIASSQLVLSDFLRRDAQKKEREEAKNSLEAHIYATRERLDSDNALIESSTEAERTALQEALSTAASFLEEHEDAARTAADLYKDALRAARKPLLPVQRRIDEATALPAAIKSALDIINTSLALSVNITEFFNITTEEIEELHEEANKLGSWLAEVQQSESNRARNVDSAYSSSQVTTRAADLSAHSRRLLRRPMKPRPKPIITLDTSNNTENAGEAAGEKKEEGKEEAAKAADEKEVPPEVLEEEKRNVI